MTDRYQHARHRTKFVACARPVDSLKLNRQASGLGGAVKISTRPSGCGTSVPSILIRSRSVNPGTVRPGSSNARVPTTRRGRRSVTPRTIEPPPSLEGSRAIFRQSLEMESAGSFLELQMLPFRHADELFQIGKCPHRNCNEHSMGRARAFRPSCIPLPA
jgi:hypothetical protein